VDQGKLGGKMGAAAGRRRPGPFPRAGDGRETRPHASGIVGAEDRTMKRDTKENERKRDSGRQDSGAGKASESVEATKRARQGEPLTAERPRERSPKQENL